MKEIDFEEFKKIQLNLLEEFTSFCDKNNLRYFLGYGSLIGAIRHHGFIPWDDDIDLMMPRPDYEKFIKEYNKTTNSSNFVYSLNTDSNYIYPFAKLANTKTLLVEDVNRDQIGINIDIFPIDGLPTNKLLSELHISFVRFFRKITFWKLIRTRKEYGISKNIALRIIQLICKLFPTRLSSFLNNFFSKLYNFENSKYVAHNVWGYGSKEKCRRELFQNYTYVDFEDLKVKTMIGYDEFLRNIYGEYMKLPPQEKRVSVHSFLKVYWM
jgi:lipopolysaccharide cholinephosphotransferase